MRRTAVLLLAILCVAVLALSAPPAAFAKKPAKPPPEPEPDPDPAIVYKTVERRGVKLWVMNADGTNETQILYAAGASILRPAWSPDGEKIAFGSNLNGSTGVYVIGVDGTGLTKIVETEILTAPVWSPATVPGVGDGEYRIAYNDRGDEGTDGTLNDIYVVNTDGTDKTRVVDTDDVMEGKMSWSPDGKRLVYSIADNVGDRFGIYDFSTASNTVYRHGGAMRGYHCTWPDWARTQSDKVAFQVAFGTDRDIFVVDLDDLDNPVRLTNGGNVQRYASWSPDDTKIVLEELVGKKAKPSIAVMSAADGSGRITLQSGGGAPAWLR